VQSVVNKIPLHNDKNPIYMNPLRSHFLSLLLTGSIIILTLAFAIETLFDRTSNRSDQQRKQAESYLLQRYKQAPEKHSGKDQESLAADQPDAAAFQEYLMTFDPETGTVPRERILQAYLETKTFQAKKSVSTLTWVGIPVEMGGRTRAIMFDPNDPTHEKVWAGGATGGLWYNDNIPFVYSSWTPAGDFWPVLSVRCITYDPVNAQVFYVGTGEPETAMIQYRESSGVGQGIWKSSDGGQTWAQLPSTSGFVYITDIVVRNENGTGVIYAGVVSGLYHGTHQSQPGNGMYRSADGGATWTQVFPEMPGTSEPYSPSDLEIGPNGRIYAGSMPDINGEGGAVLFYSDSGLPGSWTLNDEYQNEIENDPDYPLPGRVVIAAAPSNASVVYALIGSGFINPDNNFNKYYCFHVLRSDNGGVSWIKKNLPNDLTSGDNFATIAWHALDIGVNPSNPNDLFIGGLDVHHTTNGGNTWYRVSDWSKMYSGGGADYIHADQHIIVFRPGTSTEMFCGTDGGVFYTANASALYPDFEQRNSDYNTLQFYTCALHPGAGTVSYLGGLQDNGCLLFTGSPITIDDMVSGGDGAYCFYDENNGTLSISSYYYNQYRIFMNGNPINEIWEYSSGTFTSPADFDFHRNALYANAVEYAGDHADEILRLVNLTGNTQGTFLDMGTGSNLCFSAVTYSPHSTGSQANLFIGNQAGRLFRVEHAESTPVVTEIGDFNFPPANISSIAVGGSDDTLVVTFSNYGVPSVWLTIDGGQTWSDVETNLPDMPIRWALIHPANSRFVMLATETGVWLTEDILAGTVSWEPIPDGMGNVRTDMLRFRKSDNTVLAASHGRGFFTTTWDVISGIGNRESTVFTMYPNPATGPVMMTFNSPVQSQIHVKLVNNSGQVVLERKEKPGDTGQLTFDVSDLPAGLYFVSVDGVEKTPGLRKLVVF
jgi:photosystem II stability/assembly factor-like uncharacterized protein